MPAPSDLDTLGSSRPIELWVEDRLTREYLSLAWSYDRDFDLRVAGGHLSVFAVVHDQRVQGRGHVFGFVDRDFGVSNYNNWDHPDSGIEVFIGSRLEIENFLLDWPRWFVAL